MKHISKSLLTLVTVFFLAFIIELTACQKLSDRYGETLRILAIGNSFSDDGMEYLPALLENLGVKNVELARLYIPECSLERHMKCYNTYEATYTFYHSKAGENKWTTTKNTTLQYALDLGEWDIITLQQVSGLSGLYESYSPHLESLINAIHQVQPNARFAWHMTWAYSSDSTHKDYGRYNYNQKLMYTSITECVKQIFSEYPQIKTVIPSGTTIQTLRESVFNNPPKDLTCDGFHLDLGAGRYAATCTWYEALIKPYTQISMMGNTLRIDLGDVKVTEDNAPYIQQAAKQSVKSPYKVRPLKISSANTD